MTNVAVRAALVHAGTAVMITIARAIGGSSVDRQST